MSHQERTWVQTVDQTTGQTRWNVLVNGRPVPGGYVVQLADDAFEVHYPHIETFVKPTLEQAKERIEWAPPITEGVARIAREATDDCGGFLSADEAAAALNTSVYRVSAMVANGKLAARRRADGSAEIARSSVTELLERRADDDSSRG